MWIKEALISIQSAGVGMNLRITQARKHARNPPWLSNPGKTLPYVQQESPPAWTQEAYRPLRSKCSLCCWGRGVPHPVMVGGGVTLSSHGGGRVPIQFWWGGVPPHHPDLAWGYPIQSWWGDILRGTPHHPDLAGVPPPPSRPGMGYPPTHRPGMGYPPTEMVDKVKTLPSVILRMRAVKMKLHWCHQKNKQIY